MRTLRDAGLSARTANFARQIAVAFASWCVDTGRAESNPLAVIHKLDGYADRRRIRRPLTHDELSRLLAVEGGKERKVWYLAAALAGLRKGDMQRLTWQDIDVAAGTLTVGQGKAKRCDVIPLHSQLAEALRLRLAAARALPKAKVFAGTMNDATRLREFLVAGLARREVVTDEKGEPVMIGKGKRRRPLTRIVCEDEDGRVIDLHAMRTTLGTILARAGVAPQLAQRIMRHADYRTTFKHYTVLGLTDTQGAIDKLPTIPTHEPQTWKATGTPTPGPSTPRQPPAITPAVAGRNPAARCNTLRSLAPLAQRRREANKPTMRR